MYLILGIISDGLAGYLWDFQKIGIFRSISDPVFGMLDFGRIFCDALSPRPDGVSYIFGAFLNMGGVDLSNAFGISEKDFKEDFQLEWIFFPPQ